jgi:hypothetical protein
MSLTTLVYRQSTAEGIFFTGVLPAQDPVVNGFVKSWLERAQGGAFLPDQRLCFEVLRLTLDIGNATEFSVHLYDSFMGTEWLLYDQDTAAADEGLFMVTRPNIILGPADQIKVRTSGGVGGHMAELILGQIRE